MNQKVLDALKAGATIAHATTEGGLILLKGDERGPRDIDQEIQPTWDEFHKLREEKTIMEIDSMSRGHRIFRCQVTIYGIAR